MRIAGIGARKTPPAILAEMTKIGEYAAIAGWTVTSGHAEGADYAFECGALKNCIVYLPWDNFNQGLPILGRPVRVLLSEDLDAEAKKFHPSPGRLSHSGLALMRRNVCQVLGLAMDEPVDAVVCWTKGGKASGGTGQAMRIAKSRGIPVIDMWSTSTVAEVINELDRIVLHG